MINIDWKNGEYKMEWYDIKGIYQSKNVGNNYLYPTKKKKRRRPPVKTVKDIYSKENYYVYKGKGSYTPYLTIPFKINFNKQGDKLYDKKFALKLLHFHKIKDVGLPRAIIYDIETTSLEASDGFITSIAWIDTFDGTEHTVLNQGDERKMLKEFVKYINDNHILSLIGFNSHDFDDRYLAYRLKHNDIYFNPIKSCNVDVMKASNKLFIFGSLASIGKQLGVDEQKLDLGSDNPISLYNNEEYEKLLYYNLQDVRATKDIMEKLNILEFYKALWELSWTDFNDIPFNSKLINNLANKKLWENDLCVTQVYERYLGNFGGGFNYIINGESNEL